MTDRTCPLGEDCDLTVAWMAGAEDQRKHMHGRLSEAAARIEALEAERDVLREAAVKAEAALADIAEGEPDPDSVAENVWCKDRAAAALPGIRAALAAYRARRATGGKP